MTKPKFTLIVESYLGVGYYRLVAARAFKGVRKGELGGLVQNPNAVSHEGNCWADYESVVRGYARLRDNARLVSSSIENNGCASGDAVLITSLVCGTSKVTGDAYMRSSTLKGNALVEGRARLEGSVLSGEVHVCGNAVLCDTTIRAFGLKSRQIVVAGHAKLVDSTITAAKQQSVLFDGNVECDNVTVDLEDPETRIEVSTAVRFHRTTIRESFSKKRAYEDYVVRTAM